MQEKKSELSTLKTVLESGKKDIAVLAAKTAKAIREEGTQDALKEAIKAKRAAEYFAQVGKELGDAALAEAAKHGSKTFSIIGCEVQIKAVSTQWDYSNCNDAELVELERKFSIAKAALEARQKFLQALPSSITTVDEESGDVNTVHPAVKKQKEGISLTI